MNIIKLIFLSAALIILSGCAATEYRGSVERTFFWSDYGYGTSDSAMQSNASHPSNYKKPRQYIVTDQDQEKFNRLNARINKRISKVKNSSSSMNNNSDINAEQSQSMKDSSESNVKSNDKKQTIEEYY